VSPRDIAPEAPVADPHAVDFDPYSPVVLADQAAAHKRLREACPFHHFDGFGERGFWTLSTHADITEVLKDAVLWTTALGPGPEVVPRQGTGVLLNADPPIHTTQRRLVNKAFTPRAVASMEPAITQTAHQLVDAFVARGRGDLVADFAYPLPVIVIARMLGVPEAEMATFKHWSDCIAAAIGGEAGTRDANVRARQEFAAYFMERILQREAWLAEGRELPDDLVSGLVAAEYEGGRLSHPEMLGMLVQLLVAGNETTTSMLTNLVERLLQNPGEMAKVMADWSLAESAVEESLRFDAPVQGLFRTNTEPVRVHGVELDADTKVMVLFASANRDALVWDDPDTFRVDRPLQQLRQHYGFGFGTHFCLGAPLARLEGRIALRVLLERLPNLRLDGLPVRVPPMIFKGYQSFPIAWDPPT
jgi:cytochrome P450